MPPHTSCPAKQEVYNPRISRGKNEKGRKSPWEEKEKWDVPAPQEWLILTLFVKSSSFHWNWDRNAPLGLGDPNQEVPPLVLFL